MEVDHEGSGAAQDQDPAARRESVHENAPQLLRRETVRGTTLTLSHRPTTVLVAKLAEHLCGARTMTTKLAMFDSPVTSRKNFVLMWEQQPGATYAACASPISLPEPQRLRRDRGRRGGQQHRRAGQGRHQRLPAQPYAPPRPARRACPCGPSLPGLTVLCLASKQSRTRFRRSKCLGSRCPPSAPRSERLAGPMLLCNGALFPLQPLPPSFPPSRPPAPATRRQTACQRSR